MSKSSSLILGLVAMLPRELIVEKLEESLSEFKIDPSEENWLKLNMACQSLSIKATAGRAEGKTEIEKAMSLVKDFEETASWQSLNPKDNKQ